MPGDKLTIDWDPDEEVDVTQRGWKLACPYSSAINARQTRKTRSGHQGIDDTPSDPLSISSRTFISSHSALMDICNHPSLIPLHGALSHNSPHHSPLTPLFSLSKTSLHADILGVPYEQWVDTSTVPWIRFEDKKENRLLWRGSNTGVYYSRDTDWRDTHRVRFVNTTNVVDQVERRVLPGAKGLEVGLKGKRKGKGKGLVGARSGKTVQELSEVVDWGMTNVEWMDVAFTGSPIRESVIQRRVWKRERSPSMAGNRGSRGSTLASSGSLPEL